MTSIKDITRLFGADIILLWTALILKKRVAVYSEKLGILLKLIRGFPVFVWHRQNWNILRPHVDLNSEREISELKAAGVYCAGFTNPALKANSNLWDILVDINAREIRVADHAQSDFQLCAFQKNLCNFLVSSSEDPAITSQQFIKGLVDKTKELLQKLSSLVVQENEDSPPTITLAGLQAVSLPPGMDLFLFRVAAAEGMTSSSSSSSLKPQSSDTSNE